MTGRRPCVKPVRHAIDAGRSRVGDSRPAQGLAAAREVEGFVGVQLGETLARSAVGQVDRLNRIHGSFEHGGVVGIRGGLHSMIGSTHES